MGGGVWLSTRFEKHARLGGGGGRSAHPNRRGHLSLHWESVGQWSLCSQALLLPLGVPPTPGAGTPHRRSQSCGARRVLTTTSDVGDVTQRPWGPAAGVCRLRAAAPAPPERPAGARGLPMQPRRARPPRRGSGRPRRRRRRRGGSRACRSPGSLSVTPRRWCAALEGEGGGGGVVCGPQWRGEAAAVLRSRRGFGKGPGLQTWRGQEVRIP